jgi:hypothetical protein
MTGLSFDPSTFLQSHVILAAAGVALVVFIVALAVRWAARPKPRPVDPLAKRLCGPEDTGLPVGALPRPKPGERRKAHRRREGQTAEVTLAKSEEGEELGIAYVLNRSGNGIGLLARFALPAGMHVCMMPRKAGGTPMPWIPLEVKNCRQDGSDYEIGCQFVRPPSWNTLMHLG